MSNTATTPTIIDRLVGVFDPMRALRRHTARTLLARAYEGGSKKDGWRPRNSGASANTDHAVDASTMRARARSLYQNAPYITKGVEALVSNIIGTGIVPRSLGKNGKTTDELWERWGKVCDADGILDIYGMQAAAARAMFIDGEVLIRLRPRRAEDGLPVPLQLQLLEIDWLDSSKTGTVGGNDIINGIEYNPLGKVAAYWLFDQHPGELRTTRRGRAASRAVPAASIIHLYDPQRPGQGRGITRLAPVIFRARDLQTYEDAELQRKNLETRLSVLGSGRLEDMTPPHPDDTRSQAEINKTGNLGALAGGEIIRVPDGLNLTVLEPKAAPGYVDYVRHNLHIIAAGMGVTYEMLTSDVSQVNFSSARVSMLEFRRMAEALQWLTIIPRLCRPIWEEFIKAAELSGAIATRADNSLVDYATPKWSYVNPVQDVNADLAEISGGLSSFSEKLRVRGYKPDMVFAELKSDLERLQKDGTLDLLVMLQKGRTMTEATASQSTTSNL